MTSTLTKGKLLRQDQNNYDGISLTGSRADSSGGTYDGLKIGDSVDVLTVYGDGDQYTYATINSAVSAVGSANVTFRFAPGTWTIDSNLTIPSNITVYIASGAVFSVSSSITLTISGALIREHSTWKSGSGSVVNNPLSKSTDYTTVAATDNKLLEVTGTTTITLMDAASAGAGYRVSVKNIGSGTVTIARDTSADTIDGVAADFSIDPLDYISLYVNASEDGYLIGDNNIQSNAFNYVINPTFSIAQELTSVTAATTPANNDDTYVFDDWILLSDGNDIVDVSQETTITPDLSLSCAKFEVETANKKFGLLKIFENTNTANLAGATASFSFQARTTSGKVIENVRAVLLSWTGTADSVTSDVVSTWNSEGIDPTWATSWTAENTPTDMAVNSDSFTTHKVEGVSIDTAGVNNIALFIWVDDTDAAVDDVLYLGNFVLNIGTRVRDFQPRLFQEELDMCQRYFEKSYKYNIAAGTVTNAGCVAGTQSGTFAVFSTTFQVQKRTNPTVTIYSTSTGASAKAYNSTTASDNDATLFTNGERGISVRIDSSSDQDALRFNWTASARL